MKPRTTDLLLSFLVAFFFAVSVPGHLLLPEAMKSTTPWILAMFGLLVIFRSIAVERSLRIHLCIWFVLVFVFTCGIEALGLRTGWPFGSYSYSEALGPRVLGAPLLIGLNWVLVTWGLVSAWQPMLAKLSRNRVRLRGRNAELTIPGFWVSALGSVLAGLSAVVFDLALEPFAIAREYWTWNAGGPGAANFAAWFGVTALAAFPAFRVGLATRSLLPPIYAGIQFVFFVLMNFLK